MHVSTTPPPPVSTPEIAAEYYRRSGLAPCAELVITRIAGGQHEAAKHYFVEGKRQARVIAKACGATRWFF